MIQGSHQACQREERAGSHYEQQCPGECFGQHCDIKQRACADEFTHKAQNAKADGKAKAHADAVERRRNRTVFGSERLCSCQNQTAIRGM